VHVPCTDAQIIRKPGAYGYPIIEVGTVKEPKFGYIFVEDRSTREDGGTIKRRARHEVRALTMRQTYGSQ
jgi:hypothetical protein